MTGLDTSLSIRTRTSSCLEEEHGHLDVSKCVSKPSLGETITLIPNNANAVVNLFNTVALHRSGLIQAILPIAARGAVE